MMRGGRFPAIPKGETMNHYFRLFVLAFAATVAAPAMANAVDYSTLTSAVDWSTAITALMAVAALIAAVLVVRRGIGFVLRMIGR